MTLKEQVDKFLADVEWGAETIVGSCGSDPCEDLLPDVDDEGEADARLHEFATELTVRKARFIQDMRDAFVTYIVEPIDVE
jgi:hypothetical protein